MSRGICRNIWRTDLGPDSQEPLHWMRIGVMTGAMKDEPVEDMKMCSIVGQSISKADMTEWLMKVGLPDMIQEMHETLLSQDPD